MPTGRPNTGPGPNSPDLLKSDPELAERYFKGNDTASESRVFKHYSPIAARVIGKIVRDAADREDVLQLTLVNMSKSRSNVTGDDYTGYVKTVAKNSAFSYVRSVNRGKRRLSRFASWMRIFGGPGSAGSAQPAIDASFAIGEYLSLLSEDAALVLRLDLEGFSRGEIAEIANISSNRVKKTLERARKVLRAASEHSGFEDGLFGQKNSTMRPASASIEREIHEDG